MDRLDDLKAIWHTANTDSLPTSDEMVMLISKFRNEKLRNKWLVIVASCLLSFLIISILFIVDFKMVITYIGGGLIAISGLLLAATNIRSLKRFYQLDYYSNQEFLLFIEQTLQNQIKYYKKTMVVIMAFCTVGVMLYPYEAVRQYPVLLICTYAALSIYLSFMWFFVRPRKFKKGVAKLNATRLRLENILNQFK
ncbi:hypothetical protein [Mucilaginibacter polytrichastri]|uniref:Uncharacterized protein n=1 Tax=Mucilaginibacter polytrichastri TaxID=1302689 RepID=A0A1Q5ZTA4_9SPHI|nr:hypothetical protein [Mucilaginibacter polytrichastri]OKS85010.1 hypothetical protein RG47T_0448 [Mucilaginibacter polytrichastri]SFS46093.1 hypothetical protein SAMN04487890_101628 [Mucilaginibacter polytrichastri]